MPCLKNPAHEKFAQQFAAHCNARQAALSAGYSDAGNGAKVRGHELLKKPAIAARILELQQAHAERCEITSDRIMSELSAIAFANIGDFVDVTSTEVKIKNLTELDLAQLAVIKSVKVGRDKSVTLTLYDKIAALTEIAKITGLSSELNLAIATFAKYGVEIKQQDGKFFMPATDQG